MCTYTGLPPLPKVSGGVVGLGRGAEGVRKWEHALLIFAFLTMSSSPSIFEGFVLKRHHIPTPDEMRDKGRLWGSCLYSLDLLLKGRSAECGVTRDPNTGITILGQSVVKQAGFNIKIKEPKTSQLTVSFEKSKHLELPVPQSTESCKLPQLLLAKL